MARYPERSRAPAGARGGAGHLRAGHEGHRGAPARARRRGASPCATKPSSTWASSLPAKLKASIDANDVAIEAQRAASANQEAELDRINRLYDAELDRLRRLWAGARPDRWGRWPPTARRRATARRQALKRGVAARPATPSLRRSSSPACAGLALPWLAFMTWPTSALKALSLPARNSSTDFALAASTCVDDGLERAAVVHLLQAAGLDHGVDVVGLALPQRVEDLPRAVVRHRAVGHARISAASVAGASGAASMPRPCGIQPLGDLAHQPVGGQLGLAAGVAHGLVVAREGQALRHHRRVVGRQAVVALEARRHRAGQLGHRGAHALDPLRRRSPAAAGRGRGNSGSRARLPCCAWRASRRVSGSNSTVACSIARPSSMRSICHCTSKSMACCRKRKLFRFLISRRVPSGAPGRRTETLASQRKLPSCMLPSQMPSHTTSACSALAYSTASAAAAHVGLGDDLQQRRAGAVEVDAGDWPWKSSCRLLPASSSRWARVSRTVRGAPSSTKSTLAALHHRDLVLADLVALGQVGVEVVLAREDRQRRDLGADRQAEADGALHRAAVEHRQRARQRQIDGAGLRVGRGAEGGGARR